MTAPWSPGGSRSRALLAAHALSSLSAGLHFPDTARARDRVRAQSQLRGLGSALPPPPVFHSPPPSAPVLTQGAPVCLCPPTPLLSQPLPLWPSKRSSRLLRSPCAPRSDASGSGIQLAAGHTGAVTTGIVAPFFLPLSSCPAPGLRPENSSVRSCRAPPAHAPRCAPLSMAL